jgi:hypothetical protein
LNKPSSTIWANHLLSDSSLGSFYFLWQIIQLNFILAIIANAKITTSTKNILARAAVISFRAALEQINHTV